MKRDLDLCREILCELEKNPDLNAWVEIEIEGRSREEIVYQIHLLRQAGLIEAIDVSTTSSMNYRPQRLTWAGHEFLDAARSDSLWKKAKSKVQTATGGLAFEFVKAVLVSLGKEAIGLGATQGGGQ